MQHDLQRTVSQVVDRLRLPTPWNVERFVAQVAAVSGRPIELLPTDTAGGMCGLWVATDKADYIAFERGTSEPHQQWIIVHELGHIVFGHPGRVADRRLTTVAYDDWQEQQAEAFAAEVMLRADRPVPSPLRTEDLRIVSCLDPGDPVVVLNRVNDDRHSRGLRGLWARYSAR
jgi:hypothetical protein